MKLNFLASLLLILCSLMAPFQLNADNAVNWLELYQLAENNRSSCDQLIQSTASASTALQKAYHGGGLVILANHLWAPTSKLSSFNKGTAEIDEAISEDASNPEIRFIRYSIQLKAPSFLGYNKHLAEDRKIIFEKLANYKNPSFQRVASLFLLKNSKCTPEEETFLNQWK